MRDSAGQLWKKNYHQIRISDIHSGIKLTRGKSIKCVFCSYPQGLSTLTYISLVSPNTSLEAANIIN